MQRPKWKLWKRTKGNARIKNKVIEMKDTFDGLINRLDTAKEEICELED